VSVEGAQLRAWDFAAGALKWTRLLPSGRFLNIATAPGSDVFLASSSDRAARLWNFAAGEPMGAPLTHDDDIRNMALFPGAKTAACATTGGKLALWDLASGKRIGKLLEIGQRQPLAVAIAEKRRRCTFFCRSLSLGMHGP
jgi:WD40 repeat protein